MVFCVVAETDSMCLLFVVGLYNILSYNRNTTQRCRTKKCIARSWSNLVNKPEG